MRTRNIFMTKEKIISIVKDIYLEKKNRNNNFNFKLFAKELKISSSFLSEFLNGKKNISQIKANEIAEILNFSKTKKKYFIALATFLETRSEIEKTNALEIIETYEAEPLNIKTSSSTLFSNWFYFAILELTVLTDFDFTITNVSKYLGISTHETKYAIEALIKANALTIIDGKYKANDNFTFTEDNVPSKNLKICNKELIKKSFQAIDEQSVDERYISSTVIAIPESNITKAKQIIKEFHLKILNELTNSNTKDKLYCFNISFFDLKKK